MMLEDERHAVEREVMLAVLQAIDPPDNADQLSYVEVLRANQHALEALLIHSPPAERPGRPETEAGVSSEAEAAIRQAVAHFDPHNDDHLQDGLAMIERLQATVDLELSRWTSAPVQPAGPSGERAVPEPPPAEPLTAAKD